MSLLFSSRLHLWSVAALLLLAAVSNAAPRSRLGGRYRAAAKWKSAVESAAGLEMTCEDGKRVCGGPGLRYMATPSGGQTNQYCQDNCVKDAPSDLCSCTLCMCGGMCPEGSTQIMQATFDSNSTAWPAPPGQSSKNETLQSFNGLVDIEHGASNWSSVAYDTGYNFTRGLGITYNKGCVGFRCTVRLRFKIDPPLQEAYLGFFVRFSKNFYWQKGGKIGGTLCGGTCPTANGMPTGYDGFSSMLVWKPEGVAGNYLYHAGQPWTEQGEGQNILSNQTFVQEQWHHILVRVRMNTPDLSDGAIETWLDGKLITSQYDLVWRKTFDIAIDQFLFTTFFGGQSRSFAPPRTADVVYDDYLLCKVW